MIKYRIALVLACLSCVSPGKRLQSFTERQLAASDSQIRKSGEGSSEIFARLLALTSSITAFRASCRAAASFTCQGRAPASRHILVPASGASFSDGTSAPAVRPAWHAPARAHTPCCCDLGQESNGGAEGPPEDENSRADLGETLKQIKNSLIEAQLRGQRKLTVSVFEDLAVDEEWYAPLILEVAQTLTIRDGEILLLMPNMRLVDEAQSYLNRGLIWPDDEVDRVVISPLVWQGSPTVGDSVPGSVVIVSPSDSDMSAWIRQTAWINAVDNVICINPLWENGVPREMDGFLMAYSLATYDLAKGGTSGENPEDVLGRACLWRRYPEPWKLLYDHEQRGEWALLETYDEKPSQDTMDFKLGKTALEYERTMDTMQKIVGGIASQAAEPETEEEERPVEAPDLVEGVAMSRSADQRGVFIEKENDEFPIASCQVVPDGAGDGIASLERLFVASTAARAAARDVIKQALFVASAFSQTAIVVPPPEESAGALDMTQQILMLEAFRPKIPPQVEVSEEYAEMEGVRCRLLKGSTSEEDEEEIMKERLSKLMGAMSG